MAADTTLAAQRPASDPASPSPLRVFRPGQRVATPTGARRAEGLRPGDRILTGSNGRAVPVLWVSVQFAGSGRKEGQVHVMLDRPGTKAARGDMPAVSARVCPQTGTLEFDTKVSPGRVTRKWVH